MKHHRNNTKQMSAAKKIRFLAIFLHHEILEFRLGRVVTAMCFLTLSIPLLLMIIKRSKYICSFMHMQRYTNHKCKNLHYKHKYKLCTSFYI